MKKKFCIVIAYRTSSFERDKWTGSLSHVKTPDSYACDKDEQLHHS